MVGGVRICKNAPGLVGSNHSCELICMLSILKKIKKHQLSLSLSLALSLLYVYAEYSAHTHTSPYSKTVDKRK